MIKKVVKIVEINTKNCECSLEYTNVKNDLIVYKCLWYGVS